MKRMILLASILITSSLAFYIQAELSKNYVYPGELVTLNVSVFASQDLENEPVVIKTDFGFEKEKRINATRGTVYSFSENILLPENINPGIHNIIIFTRFYKKDLLLTVQERPLDISVIQEGDYSLVRITAKHEVRNLSINITCEGTQTHVFQEVLHRSESIEKKMRCKNGKIELSYEYYGKRKEEKTFQERNSFPWMSVLLVIVVVFIIWRFVLRR